MSNNNGGGAIGGLILLLVLGYILIWIMAVFAIASYFLLSFYAIVLTLISIFAWNRPRRFFKLGIVPYQARGIVCFGIAGSILAQAFALFVHWMLELSVGPEGWFHLVMGGYALGAYYFVADESFDARQVEYYYQREQEILAPAQPKPALPAPPKTFNYGDWQDPQEWEDK